MDCSQGHNILCTFFICINCPYIYISNGLYFNILIIMCVVFSRTQQTAQAVMYDSRINDFLTILRFFKICEKNLYRNI